MPCYTNMRIDGSTGLGSVVLPATGPTIYAHCPSARPLQAQNSPVVGAEQFRNSISTYSRGYKEVTTITTGFGVAWFHRRIVFVTTILSLAQQGYDPTLLFAETAPSGMVRTAFRANDTDLQKLMSTILDGGLQTDFTAYLNAKVDTQRVKLLSDKTRTINPGNAAGMAKIEKSWFSTSKNIVYNNDEAGSSEAQSYVSADYSGSMGDLIVLDMWYPASNDGTSTLIVNHEGAYYWHEK